MTRILALVLAVALVGLGVPVPAFAAQQNGSIQGVAKDNGGKAVSNTTVRLRNVATGQVTGTTQSAANGAFSFTAPAGDYVVEVVDATGKVIATSSAITLTSGAAVSGVVVTVGGAAAAAAAAGGAGIGGFFASTTGILVIAAGAGVVTGVIVGTRSSSK